MNTTTYWTLIDSIQDEIATSTIWYERAADGEGKEKQGQRIKQYKQVLEHFSNQLMELHFNA